MSDAAADSPRSPRESWICEPEPREGWSRKKFLFWLAIAILLHLGLIMVFGTKKPVVPIAHAQGVPHLAIVDKETEMMTLADPTLFARPNPQDLVSAFWRRVPAVGQPNFSWTEPPLYLSAEPKQFGAVFRDFLRTNPLSVFALDLKPTPTAILPVVNENPMPSATTWRFLGGLAQRRLLTDVKLPSLYMNDVIAPSRVRLLVDPSGNVTSAVLLPLDSDIEEKGRSAKADTIALGIASSLRFEPASSLAFGEIIFRWHTVPLTTTNAP